MGFPPALATSIPPAIPKIVPSSRRLLSERTGGSTPALFEKSRTLTVSSQFVGAIPSLIPSACFERASQYRHTTADDGMKSGKMAGQATGRCGRIPDASETCTPGSRTDCIRSFLRL